MSAESPSTLLGGILRPGPTREGDSLAATGRAGRNLPAAITTGVVLVVIVAVPLFFYRPAFVAVVMLIALAAIWELGGAFARMGVTLAVPALYVGTIGILTCSWVLGPEALLFALFLTVFACIAWRLADPSASSRINDVVSSIFAAVYIPFLASFFVLTLKEHENPWILALFVLLIVGNDTGGWAAGILFGRHPMAPRLSPKKSWEGFAGSVIACIVIGVAGVHLLGGNAAWGLLLGLVGAAVGTVGDLTESLIKREAGIKDMSSLLPGHGGVLDRVDALLMAAPVLYLITSFALDGRS
ncbi:phosphatidate cytidylyltransferase [Schaalia vaccimaxillae]|uniref:phosphatidate cytidylyltransferase n=1 Tax=Schaalia vaccimaxillae TaxID=183916 RepID=UPI0003B73383|nr:phosphatidate cytidylyltransferase [Schaalia vaccimaxillae]